MQKYLYATKYIDWQAPAILAQAKDLARDSVSDEVVSRKCFEFVRDQIKHSWDHQINIVTLCASQVLENHTGYCYAKSHLLAALLRANNIPAGLCYQRLDAGGGHFCLHGFNAVYLELYGWYRFDPRGNKPGVSCRFTLPVESLAFGISIEGEIDSKYIYAEPLDEVVKVLGSCNSIQQVDTMLPDLDVI